MSAENPAGDFPQISNVSYASNLYQPEETTTSGGALDNLRSRRVQANPVQSWGEATPVCAPQFQQPKHIDIMDAIKRRIVQVFVADPNPNVPLNAAVLYEGKQKLTDSTDQELFFEIGLGQILADYNTMRVKWLDKEATRKAGRDVFLEDVKIRELKMVVVDVAVF